jgi:hypothetical protein
MVEIADRTSWQMADSAGKWPSLAIKGSSIRQKKSAAVTSGAFHVSRNQAKNQ